MFILKCCFIICFILLNFNFKFALLDVVSSKIIGGSNAGENEFPYQAAIQEKIYFRCAGSIIAPLWILSVAHCLLLLDFKEVRVVVGSNRLNSNGTIYRPLKFYAHENFNFQNLSNDIGLIRLKKPINFTERVKPIKLTKKKTPPGTKVVVSGWGETSKNGNISEVLQKANLVTTNLTYCIQEHANSKDRPTCDNICTFTDKGKANCAGDSGSPLVDIKTKKQVGIVSFGDYCDMNEPDVYTKVLNYRKWIQEKMSKYS